MQTHSHTRTRTLTSRNEKSNRKQRKEQTDEVRVCLSALCSIFNVHVRRPPYLGSPLYFHKKIKYNLMLRFALCLSSPCVRRITRRITSTFSLSLSLALHLWLSGRNACLRVSFCSVNRSHLVIAASALTLVVAFKLHTVGLARHLSCMRRQRVCDETTAAEEMC